jgi:hypothetical protein
MSMLKLETNKVSSLEDVLERKTKIHIEKLSLENKITKLIKEEKNINKYLWTNCKHKWTLDLSCSDDDLCKRYCSVCDLRMLKLLYN